MKAAASIVAVPVQVWCEQHQCLEPREPIAALILPKGHGFAVTIPLPISPDLKLEPSS